MNGMEPPNWGWLQTSERPKIHQPKNFPDTPVDPTRRFRIATRIHFALLRHYGEDVSVSTLLLGENDAREALWVCEASGHDELVALSREFNAAPAPAVGVVRAVAMPLATAARGTVPQDLAWSQDTSGFGLSRPSELAELGAPVPRPTRWLNPSSWLRSSPR